MATRFSIASALTMLVVGGATGFAQQSSLQQVKDLYAQAAYEEALGALGALPDTESTAEIARYRAACLVALGRADDARKTVVQAVEAHPDYAPDPADTSPRVMQLFKDVRRELLPGVAKRMYSEARAAMDRKDAAAAVQGLERLIRLLDSPELAGDATSSDLKILATGFLELTKAQLTPPPAPEPPAPTPPPVEPIPPPVTVTTVAVPIRQVLPQWLPPAGMSQYTDFRGSVRVQIGADGKVISATIVEPIHPAYDRLLLAAARDWLYEPARRDGVPVASEHTVQVSLKAR